jgi:hypothetical protein
MLKIIRSKETSQIAQDPSEIKEYNLNNIIHEASWHFRNKKRDI